MQRRYLPVLNPWTYSLKTTTRRLELGAERYGCGLKFWWPLRKKSFVQAEILKISHTSQPASPEPQEDPQEVRSPEVSGRRGEEHNVVFNKYYARCLILPAGASGVW